MVILILSVIIVLLTGFIFWMLKQFFVYVPNSENGIVVNEPPTPKLRDACINSIVGKTKSEFLKPPLSKSKKNIRIEEIEDVFMNNEFDTEYSSDSTKQNKDDDLSEEESIEVISTEYNTKAEDDNKQIAKTICTDYEQIEKSIRKIVRNQPLDNENVETIQQLKNTDLDAQMESIMPEYLLKVRNLMITKSTF